MRPFVTTLDADVPATLLDFVEGGKPDLCCVSMAYNDLESYVLNTLFPSPCPMPVKKSPPRMVPPATKEQVVDALHSLQGGAGMKAFPGMNWLAILQLILQLIGGLVPKPTP